MSAKVIFDESDYVAMREHEKRRNELLRNVRYEPTDGPKSERWSAVDDSTYSGPPDPVGTGPTQEDALLDLMEQMDL